MQIQQIGYENALYILFDHYVYCFNKDLALI